MRIIGILRLSVAKGDEGDSLQLQRKTVGEWAASRGHTVVGWAVDDGVSGAIDPWKRPGLSPWLTVRSGEWDTAAASKVDRFSRRLGDVVRLVEWAEESKKTIVAVQDGLDSSGPMGPMPFYMLGMGADMELRRIRQRNQESAAGHRADGRNHGGKVLTGYRLVGPKSNLRLEIDPETAPMVRSWVSDAISGKSVGSIAKAHGRNATSLWAVLLNPAMWGVRTHKLEPVYGPDGRPIMALAPGADPLIDRETFDQLQVALRQRAQKRDRPGKEPFPVEIRCLCQLKDGSIVGAYDRLLKMVSSGSESRGKKLRCVSYQDQYRANHGTTKGCGSREIRHGIVADAIAELVERIGTQPELRKEWTPGSGPELARVEKAIKRLQSDRDLEVITEAEYATRVSPLVARRKALSAAESADGGWSVVGTGRSVAEAYRAAETDEQRRAALASFTFTYDGFSIGAVNIYGTHGVSSQVTVRA